MFKILEKRLLAENIYLLQIEAPRVAQSALPGQFVIVRVDEQGERVPLTIADFDKEKGSVTIVIQTIGVSTRKLCALGEGDYIADFAGPLGNPSEFIHLSEEELKSIEKLARKYEIAYERMYNGAASLEFKRLTNDALREASQICDDIHAKNDQLKALQSAFSGSLDMLDAAWSHEALTAKEY
ncbi:MAG: FAD-binding oxidoreductase, partial [Alistipes sp.]|nr:FAD-binding oxidoreductase [Alistipes sp.]